jgi:iron-sulfur cluster repair protein YtfE (RIC family)
LHTVLASRRAVIHAAPNWATFHQYLIIHHTAEDEMLWPPMRTKHDDSSEVDRLLDQMVDEHIRLNPLLQEMCDPFWGHAMVSQWLDIVGCRRSP